MLLTISKCTGQVTEKNISFLQQKFYILLSCLKSLPSSYAQTALQCDIYSLYRNTRFELCIKIRLSVYSDYYIVIL